MWFGWALLRKFMCYARVQVGCCVFVCVYKSGQREPRFDTALK